MDREEFKIRRRGKGIRWMPWYCMAKKDVVNCEKLRGVVSELRSVDFRMGQPGFRYRESSRTYFNSRIIFMWVKIGVGGEPAELKHLSKRRKRK